MGLGKLKFMFQNYLHFVQNKNSSIKFVEPILITIRFWIHNAFSPFLIMGYLGWEIFEQAKSQRFPAHKD